MEITYTEIESTCRICGEVFIIQVPWFVSSKITPFAVCMGCCIAKAESVEEMLELLQEPAE